MKSRYKSGKALTVSLVLHFIAIVIGFFFWPESELGLEEGAVNAVFMKVEKPKTKRMTRPKRARIRKPTETNVKTNQPNLKILTSNAPVTERGIASATAATRFGDLGSLNLSPGTSLATNIGKFDRQVREVVQTRVKKPEPVQEERPKSRLVKFIERQEGPQRIIYCVDLSSSMLGLNPRKLQKIITIMQDSLTFLEPHDQFNIATFSGEIEFYRSNFIAVNDGDVADAIAYLDTAKPEKSSRYSDKDMFEALQETKKQGPTITVLFSDGILTSGLPDVKAIPKHAAGNARIFTMATEMAEDFPGAVLLKMLADNSNGEFWLVEGGK